MMPFAPTSSPSGCHALVDAWQSGTTSQHPGERFAGGAPLAAVTAHVDLLESVLQQKIRCANRTNADPAESNGQPTVTRYEARLLIGNLCAKFLN